MVRGRNREGEDVDYSCEGPAGGEVDTNREGGRSGGGRGGGEGGRSGLD